MLNTFVSTVKSTLGSKKFHNSSNPIQQILGNTVLLSLIGLLNRALTVITQMVIASRFGATIYSDAYFATEVIPDLFIVLIGSGLSMMFIPIYGRFRSNSTVISNSSTVEEKETVDQNEDWHFASAFIVSTTILFLALTVILFITAPSVVSLLAPGFSGEVREMTITLFRIMILTVAFLGPEAGLRGLFHINREFATPDLSRFAYNLLLLFAIFFFSHRIGINSIAWGMVVGAAIMIGIQFVRAQQLGLIQRKWAFYHPAIADVLKKTPAVLAVLAWPMIMLLLDRRSSSGLEEGNLAALGYAGRIAMLPIGIVAIPLSTVLYPGFADLANAGSYKKISEQLTSGLRILLFSVLPVCVGIATGRHEIVELLFERGEFNTEATAKTSSVLFLYILAVPGFAALFFLRGIYLSINKPWSLSILLICLWGCNILLNLVMVRFWGAEGIAVATVVVAIITPLIMLYHLKHKVKIPVEMQSIMRSTAQMCILTLIMAFIFQQVVQVNNHYWANPNMIGQLINLLFSGIVSLTAYLLLARIINLPESIWIEQKVLSRF